jgi:shingomyelin synthase
MLHEKKLLTPIIITIISFIIIMFLQCMALNYTTLYYPDPLTQLQLPDIFLDVLPNIPNFVYIATIIIIILIIISLRICWILYTTSLNNPDKYLILILRFFVCYSFASLFRIITIISTILPATNNYCKERPIIHNYLTNAMVGLVSFGSANVYCGDMLFSGHSIIITLCVCVIFTYSNNDMYYYKYTSLFLSIIAYFALLISRLHYTDDILIAIYVTTSSWILIGKIKYETAIDNYV